MCEELETAFGTAACYRRLWLNDAHTLGQVAEILADALGWQPTDEQILPDALELAEVAASRIVELERVLSKVGHRGSARRAAKSGYVHNAQIALN